MKQPNPLLEDLKSVLPTIAANAMRAEQDRSVPAENIALLKSIGMHRAFLPKHYGGMEITLPEFAQCIALLAGACASARWNTSTNKASLLAKCAYSDALRMPASWAISFSEEAS